jgi:hypothetical protein
MTLATRAAPLNSERRDTSVSGTRAVVSSQQLMGASKSRREVNSTLEIRWCNTPDTLPLVAAVLGRTLMARSCSSLATIERP